MESGGREIGMERDREGEWMEGYRGGRGEGRR